MCIRDSARAMYDRPDIFIVDETTTALSQKGRKIIYNIMRKQSQEGKAVLFISHDLDELMEICNAINVLRDGRLIATMEKDGMEIPKMRSHMVGREISDQYYRSDFDGSFGDEIVMRGENITCGESLENFSFELHKGEILGIGGLSECGMHDLGRGVFGADKLLTGSVTLADGTKIKNPRQAISKKIGYVSKNRDQEAVILNDTIRITSSFPTSRCWKKGLISAGRQRRNLQGSR